MPFRKKALKYLLRSRTIDEKTGCWLFTGPTKYQSGYGRIEINGKRYFVQRLSLFIWSDFDLDSDLYALHKKECQNRKCFNPEHLYAGNAQDNINDAIKLGHLSSGLCRNGHRLSAYRCKGRRNNIKRFCKICRKEKRL